MPQKLKAKPILFNLPSNDTGKSNQFFTDFLGISFARALYDQSEVYHAPVSADGIDLNVGPRHSPQETPTLFFGVDHINQALDKAKGLGAKVLWGPEALPISPEALPDYQQIVEEEFPDDAGTVSDTLGQGAVLQDPGGAVIGLVEVAQHAHGHFKLGKYYKGLDDKQVNVHKKAMKAAQKVHH